MYFPPLVNPLHICPGSATAFSMADIFGGGGGGGEGGGGEGVLWGSFASYLFNAFQSHMEFSLLLIVSWDLGTR